MMTSLVVRLLASAAALGAAVALVDGVVLEGDSTQDQVTALLLVALLFGVVNTVVKPVVKLVSLPLFVLTLGLVTFVINALMLWLTGWLAEELELAFSVDGFSAAFLGALVVSVASFAINLVLPDR